MRLADEPTSTHRVAKWNGCPIDTLPIAPTGGHVCTDYKEGAPRDHPVRWCSYQGGYAPLPNDAGKNSSWMPLRDVALFVAV